MKRDEGISSTEVATALPDDPEPRGEAFSIKAQIAAFLDGETHGEALLHALYDPILDEPIPPQMRALLAN